MLKAGREVERRLATALFSMKEGLLPWEALAHEAAQLSSDFETGLKSGGEAASGEEEEEGGGQEGGRGQANSGFDAPLEACRAALARADSHAFMKALHDTRRLFPVFTAYKSAMCTSGPRGGAAPPDHPAFGTVAGLASSVRADAMAAALRQQSMSTIPIDPSLRKEDQVEQVRLVCLGSSTVWSLLRLLLSGLSGLNCHDCYCFFHYYDYRLLLLLVLLLLLPLLSPSLPFPL
jgi:hypothetical protein